MYAGLVTHSSHLYTICTLHAAAARSHPSTFSLFGELFQPSTYLWLTHLECHSSLFLMNPEATTPYKDANWTTSFFWMLAGWAVSVELSKNTPKNTEPTNTLHTEEPKHVCAVKTMYTNAHAHTHIHSKSLCLPVGGPSQSDMVIERGEDQDSLFSCQLAICLVFALPHSHTLDFVSLYPAFFQQTVQWPAGLSIRLYSPSHWTLNL